MIILGMSEWLAIVIACYFSIGGNLIRFLFWTAGR